VTVPFDLTFCNPIAETYAARPLQDPAAFERKIEVMKSRLRPTGMRWAAATLLWVAALSGASAAWAETAPDDAATGEDAGVEDTVDDPPVQYRWTASMPYLTLMNFDPDHPTIYEAYLGYRITPDDLLAIKAVTWKLNAPLGIPWGRYLGNKSEYYPGTLRETGVGLLYQRFLWKGLYASVQVAPMVKKYRDEDKEKVGGGFRLYTSYHVGYHLSMFRNRVYIEPQVHCNYWPIDTGTPPAFAPQEAKWDNPYFLFEPNLVFGVNFGRKREDGRFVL
jgi:hypothetical protein